MPVVPLGGSNKGAACYQESFWRKQWDGAALNDSVYFALIQKQHDDLLDNAAAVQDSSEVTIPCTGHAFAAGDIVRIYGSTNYDGFWLVESAGVNDFNILSAFTSETFTGAETVHKAPSPTDDTLNDLAECPNGNGYTTGGLVKTRGTSDFQAPTVDDANFRGYVEANDLVWTASGGDCPSAAAYYLVALGYHATATSRVYGQAWWLGSESGRQVSDTQTLTIQDVQMMLYSVYSNWP